METFYTQSLTQKYLLSSTSRFQALNEVLGFNGEQKAGMGSTYMITVQHRRYTFIK